MEIKAYLAENKSIIDEGLKRVMPKNDTYPPVIHEAMAYSVYAGGKRFRPILCLAACQACGGSIEESLEVACALELIHTYSLVHDDLPGMDNDDFRRGKPTNHKVFGEANAILAGDGLLTYAFEIIGSLGLKTGQHEKALKIITEVAQASGSQGMVGGQVVDNLSSDSSIDEETLNYIHHHKTGDLIKVAVRAGAILGNANKEQLEALTNYAIQLGLAFQITDDILDIIGEEAKIGKPVGSDLKNEKATFPSLYGLEQSQIMAKEAVEQGKKLLVGFGPEAEPLRLLADYLLSREG